MLAIVVGACSSGSSGPKTHTIEVNPDLPTEDTPADASVAPLDAAESSVVSHGCTSAADCASGEICCVITSPTTTCQAWCSSNGGPVSCCGGMLIGTTSCQMPPCPDTLGEIGAEYFDAGPRQLCNTAAECVVAGDTCVPPNPCGLNLPILECKAPTDAGCGPSIVDSGDDAGTSDGAGDAGAE